MVSRQATAAPLLVTTALALVGCESTDDGLLGLVPTIDQISVPTDAVAQPATLTARVDPKAWENHNIYLRHANAAADLETTAAHEKVPVCTPIQGSTAFDCHVNLLGVPAGTEFFRWYIDYWLPDGAPDDAATVMRPEPAGQVSLASAVPGGGGGPITSAPSSG
ncbi:MAG TPA: hypothetical protein VFO41_15175, partial [Alphaproteobacteria bacterium]|nr:hypothetical protein [Alphaproteobacteria bacterium]